MPEYARRAAEVFAQARSCYQEAEQWLAGPEPAALTHAELEDQLTVPGTGAAAADAPGPDGSAGAARTAPR